MKLCSCISYLSLKYSQVFLQLIQYSTTLFIRRDHIDVHMFSETMMLKLHFCLIVREKHDKKASMFKA